MLALALLLLTAPEPGFHYRAPAGTRLAARRPGAESVLPGGRVIAPLGRQFTTGPGPFGLAVSPSGRTVVTADGGPNRFSLTILEKGKDRWTRRQISMLPKGAKAEPGEDEWRSVFMGLGFDGDRRLYASEGNSGRVCLVNVRSEKREHVWDLNQGDFKDSYTGDLALDQKRGALYVVDQANFRVVVIDTRQKRLAASVRVGRLPFALALGPDGRRLYVTNIGMFEYKAVPGADAKHARESGLPFPAFGFPSPESLSGARRQTGRGEAVDVPGLGEPNVEESNSVAVLNVENPYAPRVERFIRTGKAFGQSSMGGSSPSGVLAAGGRVYVTNGHNDSVTVIDEAAQKVAGEVELRVPGLEQFRGVLPIGMAFHEPSGMLLVAEAGINSVAAIDARAMKLAGRVPAGWFPTRVALDGDTVFVVNAKGHGTGPNADRTAPLARSFQAELRRGSVSMFPFPDRADLPKMATRVLALNGLLRYRQPPAPVPAMRHVVLIVKENRTFDEVLGDIEKVSNGPVRGAPSLARFGRLGSVMAEPGQFQPRLHLRNVNVAPNHRQMALRWAFSDNFYADSEVSVDGHHWLAGSYPNAWTESTLMAAYGGQKDFRLGGAPGRLLFAGSNSSVHPEEQLEAGALWHHLERHGIAFRNFGEGFELAGADEGPGLKPTGARFLTNVPMPDPLFRNTSREYPQYNMNIPDQYRASQFIAEVESRYGKGGEEFPRFIFIHLPNDHMARPRPEDGYPFAASYVADNDLALGRIVEYLSGTPWWRNMTVFVTEDDAQGGVDHVDSHRTVLIAAGPWVKRNYVSRVHSSFPGLLKTVFRLLGLPPLNLYDAAASDLADLFTDQPDYAPYRALPVHADLFDPAKGKDPLDPEPGPKMDDPALLKQQHRR